MSRVLVLAKSGFGKTTSLCGRKKHGIIGLNPKETFVIQCVNRSLPNPDFKLTTFENIAQGNRIQVGDINGVDRFKRVAEIIELLAVSPFKNIVIDDFNYLSQDFYMANAMKGGWDTPKQIGYGMGLIFTAFDKIPHDKSLFCLAHYEEYKDGNGDSMSFKFKSTGKMVDDYITPEGKFDVILYGKQGWNNTTKKATKEFVIEFDGEYPAKDSLGILDDYDGNIPNDLGLVATKMQEYYDRQG